MVMFITVMIAYGESIFCCHDKRLVSVNKSVYLICDFHSNYHFLLSHGLKNTSDDIQASFS